MGSFQANKSSPMVNAPMIVKGGTNYITVSNLRSSMTSTSGSRSKPSQLSQPSHPSQATSSQPSPSPSQTVPRPMPTQNESQTGSI